MNELWQSISSQFTDPNGLFMAARLFIEEKFGTPGLIAAGILLAVIIMVIISKVVKLSFDIVRFVIIPSVAVTFIGTYFLPYSFVYILPVTVAFFSIVLIIKG